MRVTEGRFFMDLALCPKCQGANYNVVRHEAVVLLRCLGCGQIATVPDQDGNSIVITETSVDLGPASPDGTPKPH